MKDGKGKMYQVVQVSAEQTGRKALFTCVRRLSPSAWSFWISPTLTEMTYNGPEGFDGEEGEN